LRRNTRASQRIVPCRPPHAQHTGHHESLVCRRCAAVLSYQRQACDEWRWLDRLHKILEFVRCRCCVTAYSTARVVLICVWYVDADWSAIFPSLDAYDAAMSPHFQLWQQLTDSLELDPGKLNDRMQYKTTDGTPASLLRWQLLLHAFNHATHHRCPCSTVLSRCCHSLQIPFSLRIAMLVACLLVVLSEAKSAQQSRNLGCQHLCLTYQHFTPLCKSNSRCKGPHVTPQCTTYTMTHVPCRLRLAVAAQSGGGCQLFTR
jgi:hypothetical protein